MVRMVMNLMRNYVSIAEILVIVIMYSSRLHDNSSAR